MADDSFSLPVELIAKIVDVGQVNDKDLVSLAFTSRKLAQTCFLLLYRKLDLTRPDAWRIVRCVIGLSELGDSWRQRVFDYGSFVQFCLANDVLVSPLAVSLFDPLLSTLSNLQQLDISGATGLAVTGKEKGRMKARELAGIFSRWLASSTLHTLDISRTPGLFSLEFTLKDLAILCPQLVSLTILDSAVPSSDLANACNSGLWPQLRTLRYNLDTKSATEQRKRSYLNLDEIKAISNGCPKLRTLAPGMGFLDAPGLLETVPSLQVAELDVWELCPVIELPTVATPRKASGTSKDLEAAFSLLSLSSPAPRTKLVVDLHVHDIWAFRGHLKSNSGNKLSLGDILDRVAASLSQKGITLRSFNFSQSLPRNLGTDRAQARLLASLQALCTLGPETMEYGDVKCGAKTLLEIIEPARNTLQRLAVNTNWEAHPLELAGDLLRAKQMAIKYENRGRNGSNRGLATLLARTRGHVETVFEALGWLTGPFESVPGPDVGLWTPNEEIWTPNEEEK